MTKHAYLALVTVSLVFGQDAWTSRMSEANRLQATGNYQEARKLYELAVLESSDLPQRQAQALNNFAAHLYEVGDYARAEPMYRKAIAAWRAVNESGRLGVTLSNLATLYRKTGRYAESIETFVEAEGYIRSAYGVESAEMAGCLVNWSEVYRVSGRLADAERTASKAAVISEKVFPPSDGRVSHGLHAHAIALQVLGRSDEARILHDRALAIREKAFGPEHPFVAATLTALVSIYLEQGRYAEAAPLAGRSLAIWESKLGPDHLNTAVALNNLAQVFRMQDRGAEAEPLYKRAIAIFRARQSPEVVKPLLNLGDFYLQRGRNAAALVMYQQAAEVARSAFSQDHPQTVAVQEKVAQAYESLGRHTEAARIYKRAKLPTTVRASSVSAP